MNPLAVGLLVAGIALLPWSLSGGTYNAVTLLGVLCILASLFIQTIHPKEKNRG